MVGSQKIGFLFFYYPMIKQKEWSQSWGYFFISDEKNIFEKSDYSQQKRDFNIQQMRKRLRKIGCFEDLDNYILIDSDSFFYFLFKEENSERFFFYGKYK